MCDFFKKHILNYFDSLRISRCNFRLGQVVVLRSSAQFTFTLRKVHLANKFLILRTFLISRLSFQVPRTRECCQKYSLNNLCPASPYFFFS